LKNQLRMSAIHPRLKIPFLILAIVVASAAAIMLAGFVELRQAETALANEDYSRGAYLFASAVRLLPWRPELWERAAAAALLAGQPEKAIEDCSHVKQLSLEGYRLLGKAYLQRGELDSALSAFQSALDMYGPTALSYSYIAEVYRQREDLIAESDALQNQLDLDPGDARAHYRLGLIRMVLDSEKAATELMFASSLDPDFDPAVQTLRTALNLSAAQPDSAEQFVTIGRALGLVNEWRLAAEAFRKAIATNGKNAVAWAWLGEAKQHLGEQGNVELGQALLLDNHSVIVHGLRGLYWKRQGEYSQALGEYSIAAKFEPKNPVWQASMGESYALLGDLPAALNAYQAAVQLDPNSATYWRLLAMFCAENGIQVEDTGLPAARKAVELAPEDGQTLDALGWSYLSSGRLTLAEQTLLGAIERDPENYPAHLHLALTYLAQGNSNAAHIQFVFVRDADPNGSSGQLAERLLEQYFP
jgi:tetratricopeptide (TPR) repeat protein